MAFLQTAGIAAQALTSAATTSTQAQENLNTVFTQVTETVKTSKATSVEELLKETATAIVDKINALNVSDEEKSALKQQAQDVLAEISKQTTDTGKDDPEHQLLQALVAKIDSINNQQSDVTSTPVVDTSESTPVTNVDKTTEPVTDTSESTTPVTDVDKTAETAKDVKKELDVAKADEIINDVTKDASNQPDKVITAEAGRGEVDVQAQETKESRKVYIPKDQYQGDNKGTGYLYYYNKAKAGDGAVEITENDAKSKGYTHALTENATATKSETKTSEKAKESKPSSIETVGSGSQSTNSTNTQTKKAESITEPSVSAAGTQPATQNSQASAQQTSPAQNTHANTQALSTSVGSAGEPASATASSLPSTGEHDDAYLPILGALTLIPIGLLLKRRKDA